MVFEHFALNVHHIDQVIHWYTTHLGLTIFSTQKKPPFMTFLADSTGRVMLELYFRPDEPITNFSDYHPLTFHVAFVSENAEEDKNRLTAQGASFVKEVRKDDGSHLVMLRDPWGMPLQLCQRTNRF
ncbi:Glyoxalase-like domain-containing protein [Arenibacter nanhaiticus]|uniref:Glyoxalase-like domain-containing protein n=1 Tax=Arenibacter nanhaiticus TaxID=558155 RepID=A0A1M6KBX6_9FLAO|nr:VOC family protein [Arenibacter nanhaiticus]SHJ56392.1 Glyoxalase-like domain-containing protein [Arenibacter nanhaiticus]